MQRKSAEHSGSNAIATTPTVGSTHDFKTHGTSEGSKTIADQTTAVAATEEIVTVYATGNQLLAYRRNAHYCRSIPHSHTHAQILASLDLKHDITAYRTKSMAEEEARITATEVKADFGPISTYHCAVFTLQIPAKTINTSMNKIATTIRIPTHNPRHMLPTYFSIHGTKPLLHDIAVIPSGSKIKVIEAELYGRTYTYAFDAIIELSEFTFDCVYRKNISRTLSVLNDQTLFGSTIPNLLREIVTDYVIVEPKASPENAADEAAKHIKKLGN